MARCTRYNIVIRSVSDLLQVGGFVRVLHHIAEILLKVMLNSIPLSLTVCRIINTSLAREHKLLLYPCAIIIEIYLYLF